MDVQSICSHEVISLDGAEPLQHAAQLMREHHVGCVVVTEQREGDLHVLGLVTDRDLAIEVLARGGDASRAPIRHLLAGPPAGVAATASLPQAVQALLAAGVRRLLVHDAQGQLVGILSADDLWPALVAPLAGLAEIAERGRQREAQARGALGRAARPALRVPAMGTAGWQTTGFGARSG